jgi:hypothetical protein
MVVNGSLTIQKGISLILQQPLNEILIDGGELLIDPLLKFGALSIAKSLRILNGGKLRIQTIHRNASLSDVNASQVYIFFEFDFVVEQYFSIGKLHCH